MYWYYDVVANKVDQDSNFERLYKRAVNASCDVTIYSGYPTVNLVVCQSYAVVYVIGKGY